MEQFSAPHRTAPPPRNRAAKRRAAAWLIGALLAGGAACGAFALDLKAPPLTPLGEDGIHDPREPAIAALQNPAASMKDFPKDRYGEVDWVKALDGGAIAPRASRTDDPWENELMTEMDLDIIMTNTMQMPHVRFPHLAHTRWLTCSNCHPGIFIPQKGANPVTMTKVLNGQFCGRCHDKVSFSLWACERCHSIPHKGSPAKWW